MDIDYILEVLDAHKRYAMDGLEGENEYYSGLFEMANICVSSGFTNGAHFVFDGQKHSFIPDEMGL